MAGSPVYIQLLHAVRHSIPFDPHPEDQSASWEELEHSWNLVTIDPDEERLTRLAKVTFRRIGAMTGQPMDKIITDAIVLHEKKNRGYAGHSPDPWINFRGSLAFGITPFQGVLIRMTDKWSRITSLRASQHNDQVGESILDTLADLAAYALIAVCLRRETDSVLDRIS